MIMYYLNKPPYRDSDEVYLNNNIGKFTEKVRMSSINFIF